MDKFRQEIHKNWLSNCVGRENWRSKKLNSIRDKKLLYLRLLPEFRENWLTKVRALLWS